MFRSSMTLGRTQRRLTAFVFAVGLGAAGVAGALGRPIGLLPATLLVCALGLSWAMAPRAIAVAGGELLVERRAWPALRLPLAAVASAAPIDRVGGRVIRLFGVGGFFGSYGLFSSDTLGRFRLYATRSGQAVQIRRNDGGLPLVVTPDDVAGTIAAIDRRPVVV
jgi:hypothetical protein